MNRWREAWEIAEEGLLLFEGDRLFYLNPAAAQMLGVAPERAAGQPLAFVLRHRRLLELARRGGEEVVSAFGRRIRVRVRGGAMFISDVSALEREREELADERRLLAHEFRTPAAGLAGLVEFLQQDPPAAERREALALMREEAERLLRLASGQGRRQPSAWSPLELRPRLARLLPRAGEVEWLVEHEVLVDRDQLYQVLVNLLDNALRYGRPPVRVRTRRLGPGHGLLAVSDAGPELADYDSLFEPGRRGVHAAGVRGSGLGLALVRRIARSWGGEARAGRVGGENEFAVTLPVAEEEAEDA